MTFKRSFQFVNIQGLKDKPRSLGLTEIRGPYYEAFTVQGLKDLLQTWGHYIDGFKFAGGSQSLLDRGTVKAFIDTAHEYQVYVNTGGFIERVIIEDSKKINDYLHESKNLGFDVVEVSSGMFEHVDDFSLNDQIEIVKKIKALGMKPKPELTIMTGVGGGSKEIGYAEKIKSVKTLENLIEEGERFFDAGAHMLMIESEGITEGLPDPTEWRIDIIQGLIKTFGFEKLMFEVSPEDDEARRTFKWYLKNVNPNINLMMNAKNIVEFNAWRLNLWGNRDLWKGKKIAAVTL